MAKANETSEGTDKCAVKTADNKEEYVTKYLRDIM
jgi:hypothetical protein